MASRGDLPEGSPRRFATTHWSLVLSAARQSSPHSRAALAELCEAYWAPLYWHVRRLGNDPAEAQDLRQGFFARLLEKEVLGYVDREKGRFRSFLLTSLRNYLANEHERRTAQKRGAGQRILSMDFASAENSYTLEPARDLTADRLFEKRWAVTVLETSLRALEEQYRSDGKQTLFESLKPFLTVVDQTPKYSEVAELLNMNVGAVKMAVSRLRRKYRELIRAEVQRTLSELDDVDDELALLLNALSD